MFANNPAVSAFAEADQRYPEETLRVVSIGTGKSEQPYSYEEAKGWGTIGWATTTIDIVFDGVSDAANYQLQHVLGDRYERFQVALEDASDAMDDASTGNLKGLTQDAERLIELHEDELSALSDNLTD